MSFTRYGGPFPPFVCSFVDLHVHLPFDYLSSTFVVVRYVEFIYAFTLRCYGGDSVPLFRCYVVVYDYTLLIYTLHYTRLRLLLLHLLFPHVIIVFVDLFGRFIPYVTTFTAFTYVVPLRCSFTFRCVGGTFSLHSLLFDFTGPTVPDSTLTFW